MPARATAGDDDFQRFFSLRHFDGQTMRCLSRASNPEKADFFDCRRDALAVSPDSAGNVSRFQRRAGALFSCDRTNDLNHGPRERSLICLRSVYQQTKLPNKNPRFSR